MKHEMICRIGLVIPYYGLFIMVPVAFHLSYVYAIS